MGEVADIAAHPIKTEAHYRLFSRWGRWKYGQRGRDVPYVSDQEWVTLGLTVAAVGGRGGVVDVVGGGGARAVASGEPAEQGCAGNISVVLSHGPSAC